MGKILSRKLSTIIITMKIKGQMKIIYFISLLLVLGACSSKKDDKPIDLAAYHSEIETWHQKRVEGLKGPRGWLNLVGLFWLNEGINTFGSGQDNSVVFPEGKIPVRAGYYLLKGNSVTLEVAPGV